MADKKGFATSATMSDERFNTLKKDRLETLRKQAEKEQKKNKKNKDGGAGATGVQQQQPEPPLAHWDSSNPMQVRHALPPPHIIFILSKVHTDFLGPLPRTHPLLLDWYFHVHA